MKKRCHIHKMMEPAEPNEVDNLSGSDDSLRHRIAETAYELYEQRCREDGHDVEDWFKAEALVSGGFQ